MRGVKKLGPAFSACLIALAAHTPAPAAAYEYDTTYDHERTGIAVYHPDGRWSGTSDALETRPALSLAKLYLGYYVLYHGTDSEKELVKDMVRRSSDTYAQRLDRAYPEAIDEIAEDFDLRDTARNGAWGRTTTSPYDMAKFVASILWDPRARPLLDGMKSVSDTAEDGFPQVFGTAKLDNVEGFKTGWADDKVSETGSVAFGQIGDDVWVAAALTEGDAYDNTADAIRGIKQIEEKKNSRFRLSLPRGWKVGEPLPVPFSLFGS